VAYHLRVRRTFLIVLDSLGVGALPDAASFGDAGTHTLDHIVDGAGGLDVPNLVRLGLGHIPGVTRVARSDKPSGAFGRCAEKSPGKDTSTGHWEMMGCVLERQFPVFEHGFPPEIIDPFVARSGVPGVLCNAPASGTEVLERLGDEHVRTGQPIVYTSADSVFQIACHEVHFGLERLYRCCEIAREILDPHGVGRVIARPFVGESGHYKRTYNRRDYSLKPFSETVLERLVRARVPVTGVGKIEDIFAGVGVPHSVHTEGNRDGMERVLELAKTQDSGLVFCNLVDFDMLYGHRRDPKGYRRALEEFDADYARLESLLRPDDLVLLTADHGNDPLFTKTTDHTREYIPVLAAGARVRPGAALGTRSSFADIGATVEEFLGLAPQPPGRSFWTEIARG
jgi:phosphopentomutase